MTNRPFTLLHLSLFLASTGLIGCGGADRPQMGYVSGLVTMGDTPVEDLVVVMKPKEGRPAMARTDKYGRYDIEYARGEKGTKVGPTTVRFEWPLGGKAAFAIPKKIMGDTSEMKLEVKKGRQTFDIQLTSEEEEAKKPAEQNTGARKNTAPGAGEPVD